ncbi:MAG: hypothetical protein F4066_12385 [Chloroflexi bacterium]|nr:hypothetical protein [Chloroflexota bacterium]MYF81581.1 hypothetical protein [Chloroflexota bacterium]MYI05638.1 hypothetical protein [Chloroflexota bacterium]
MAQRPIFMPEFRDGTIREELVAFEWFPGFSVQQKQRSIRSLHSAAAEQFGWTPNFILELSTKSHQRLGASLSAFNLTLPRPNWYFEQYPDSPQYLSLESIYQGSKVFAEGQGPHLELYQYSPRDAKRFMTDHGLRTEPPVAFRYGAEEWSALQGKTSFYDYLYLKALQYAENEGAVDLSRLGDAKAFTDIEFNPQRSLNCQARSCALYVVLGQRRLLNDAVADLESFIEIENDLERLALQPTQLQLAI